MTPKQLVIWTQWLNDMGYTQEQIKEITGSYFGSMKEGSD